MATPLRTGARPRTRTTAPEASRRRPGTRSREGRRRAPYGFLVALLAAVAALAGSVLPAAAETYDRVPPLSFRRVDLVADQPGMAPLTDPHLVNPWGLALGPRTGLWVSDNGTDVSTIYTGAVAGSPFVAAPLVVHVPGGAPTGQVFNPTDAFAVTNGKSTAPAVFLFVSEHGQISGWNPMVAPATQARSAAATPGAVYKGVAITSVYGRPRLLATNFSAGTVDVFDGSFQPVRSRYAFRDPLLPRGYAPFGIMAVGHEVIVTYAQQDEAREDDVAGPGKGFVDVFSPEGRLVRRLASRGPLNAPWGLAVAPAHFGGVGGDLLVGNFGDGRVNAFDRSSGRFLGPLADAKGRPIAVAGLWGLQFGNGVAGTPSTLFFSAGPGDEEHGLLGLVEPLS